MTIEEEILKASYQEHFKVAKELAMIFPINHWRRKKIEKSMNELQIEIAKAVGCSAKKH